MYDEVLKKIVCVCIVVDEVSKSRIASFWLCYIISPLGI